MISWTMNLSIPYAFGTVLNSLLDGPNNFDDLGIMQNCDLPPMIGHQFRKML